MSPTAKSPATDSVSQAPIVEESGKPCGYSTKYLIIFSAATVIVITAVALTLFFVLQNSGTPEKLSRPESLGATTQDPAKVPEEPTTLPDGPTGLPSLPSTNEPPEEPTTGRPGVTETSTTSQASSPLL